MEKLKLGVDEASEVIIISKAVKKLQLDQNLSPTQAIDYLTSCLTTMKLLGKVESQKDQHQYCLENLESSIADNDGTNNNNNSRTFDFFKPLQTDSSHSNCGSSASLSSSSEMRQKDNITANEQSSQNNAFKKKGNKPMKTNRKRQKEEEAENIIRPQSSSSSTSTAAAGKDSGKEGDVKTLAQKAILQKCATNATQNQTNIDPSSTSLSSSITGNRMKPASPMVSREKRELESMQQQVSKRPRLDSI